MFGAGREAVLGGRDVAGEEVRRRTELLAAIRWEFPPFGGATMHRATHTLPPAARPHTSCTRSREIDVCLSPALPVRSARRPYRVFPFAVPNTTHERSWPTCGRARCRTPCVCAEVYLTLPYLRVHTKRRSSKNTLKVLDTHEATPRATDKSHDKSPQYRRVQSVRNEERFRYHAACAAWLGNRPPHARLG